MSTFLEHVVDPFRSELRRREHEYWRILRAANADFRAQHVPRQINGYSDFLAEKTAFEHWMREQWGLEVVVDQDGYSPYYTVIDEHRYLLFELKYSGSP